MTNANFQRISAPPARLMVQSSQNSNSIEFEQNLFHTRKAACRRQQITWASRAQRRQIWSRSGRLLSREERTKYAFFFRRPCVRFHCTIATTRAAAAGCRKSPHPSECSSRHLVARIQPFAAGNEEQYFLPVLCTFCAVLHVAIEDGSKLPISAIRSAPSWVPGATDISGSPPR